MKSRFAFVPALVLMGLLGAGPPPTRPPADPDLAPTIGFQINRPIRDPAPRKATAPAPAPARPIVTRPQPPAASTPTRAPTPVSPAVPVLNPNDLVRSPVVLFALVSLAPAAVLMLTAFVRIHIVLVLLRQALGSPQVPGNQVLTALALMLTALVMRPVGEAVYTRSIRPYAEGRVAAADAYGAAVRPIKAFMLEQIQRTHHENYVWAIYDEVAVPGQAAPVYEDEFPLGVVATAFLLSELTTALVIGFFLYLPFLVVDLVVSAVLAAMGLFMLPPSLVALPLKLILFVLVNGWVQVATVLLRSFGPVGAAP